MAEMSIHQMAELFQRLTRQNIQNLGSVSGKEGDLIQFEIPKNRYLSRVWLLVEVGYKVTHATKKAFPVSPFAGSSIFSNIRIDLNNGFAPFTVSGESLARYNMLDLHGKVRLPDSSNNRAYVYVENKADTSAAPASNKAVMLVELNIALNDRDAIGYINAQNQSTVITVNAQLSSTLKELIDVSERSDYTISDVNVKVTPATETFTIPNDVRAVPVISTVKLVQSTTVDIQQNAINEMKLTTGYTYRKLVLYFTKTDGLPMNDDEIGNIELVLNQADVPYRISAKTLARQNADIYGTSLPKGMLVFDFSQQGIANLGGNRDYVNTQQLTEFWVRTQPTLAGKLEATYELLTVLK